MTKRYNNIIEKNNYTNGVSEIKRWVYHGSLKVERFDFIAKSAVRPNDGVSCSPQNYPS
jgi:hypothetical protein